MGLSALSNIFGIGNNTMEKQHQYELEKMEKQAQYNKEAATYSQELAKEMWEYTGYGNQIRQMVENDLNPALLYNQGGTQGQTTSGGRQEGVSQGISQAVGMGLETRNIEAQTRLANAQAAKAYAEAEKTAGVDTEHSETLIKLNELEGNLKETINNLQKENIENIKQERENMKETLSQIKEEVNKLKLENKFNDDTYTDRVNKIATDYANACLEGAQKAANIEFTNEQKEFIKERRTYYAQQIANETAHAKAALEQAQAALENARAANDANNIRINELAVKQRHADYEEKRTAAYERYTDAFAKEVDSRCNLNEAKKNFTNNEDDRRWLQLTLEGIDTALGYTPLGILRKRTKVTKKPTYSGEEVNTYEVSGRASWENLK